MSAKAVVVRGDAVLLARNDRGEWELPGGRIERGEEPATAVVREVAEETGLLIEATAQLGIVTFEVVPERFVLIAGFACSVTEERELVLSEEHEALLWQPLARLDEVPLPQVYRDFVATATLGRVVLIGDSHLAKLDRKQARQLSESTAGRPPVVNQAVGGSCVLDVLAEIEAGIFRPLDRFIISVGTNDYAPWKRVPLGRFRSAVEELLDRLKHHQSVVLIPPIVDEDSQVESGRANIRTEQDRAPYVATLKAIAMSRRTKVVELPEGAWSGADGVHLNDAGYALLLARLADALAMAT